MHPLQLLAALLLAATALISCQSKTASPDTVVLGQLVTMDPRQPHVTAVAISDGRSSFVGERYAALALRFIPQCLRAQLPLIKPSLSLLTRVMTTFIGLTKGWTTI
mgnify:CR=1 FL=1